MPTALWEDQAVFSFLLIKPGLDRVCPLFSSCGSSLSGIVTAEVIAQAGFLPHF